MMDQDHNNLNQNSFSKQYDNEMSNNEQLNSQRFYRINDVNNQSFDSQPEPMNTFVNGNVSNQNFYSKKSNKMKLGSVICACVGAVAIIAGVTLLFNNNLFQPNPNNSMNGNSNNQNLSGEKIIQMQIGSSNVRVLTESGKLYGVGNSGICNWPNVNERDLKEPTLLAENVKSFADTEYISNNDELYTSCVNVIEGGTYKNYEKLGTNIKKVTSSGLGLIALSNDGNIYAYGLAEYNGFGQQYDELTLIEGIKNVKDIYLGDYTNVIYYLTENNELYAKPIRSDVPFEKFLDNVNNCNANAITTNDGKIYHMEYDYSKDKVTATLVEGADVVFNSSFNEQFYTKDGVFIKCPFGCEAYNKYYPKDVETLLYMRTYDIVGGYGLKNIYITKDNKLKLQSVKVKYGSSTEPYQETKTYDYNLENIGVIADFVSNNN